MPRSVWLCESVLSLGTRSEDRNLTGGIMTTRRSSSVPARWMLRPNRRTTRRSRRRTWRICCCNSDERATTAGAMQVGLRFAKPGARPEN